MDKATQHFQAKYRKTF